MARNLALLLPAPALMAVAFQQQSTVGEAYRDGLKAQSQGDHQTAVGALRRAIELRSQPSASLMTYGNNRIEYYPYVHLGKSLLALGDLEGAGKALETSSRSGVEPESLRASLARDIKEALSRKQRAEAAAAKPATPPPEIQRPPQAAVSTPPSTQPATLKPPAQGHPGTTEGAPSAAQLERDKGPQSQGAPSPGEMQKAVGDTQKIPKDKAGPEGGRSAPDIPEVSSQAKKEGKEKEAGAPILAPQSVISGGTAGWLILAAGIAGVFAFLAWRRKKKKNADEEGTRLIASPISPAGLDKLDHLPADLGPYTLERILGHGGFATTYAGIRKADGQKVAVKVPHPHLLRDAGAMNRFRQEAQLGVRLEHPAIVHTVDPGLEAGLPWIAMELAPGETLHDLLARNGALDLKTAVQLGLEMAQALAHAHGKGIVHRDLKPANVMVHKGHAKVMDFGIARVLDSVGLTTSAMFMGTPAYAAPESMGLTKVGPAADRYALGLLLYEMLAGKPPFYSENAMAMLDMHRSAEFPNLALRRRETPPRLVRLIERLAAKLPEDRPEDPEVVEILTEVRNGL